MPLLHTILLSTAMVHILALNTRAETYDVVVYGGTSGGVAAAVQTAKLGKSVVLIEPGKHLGGLSSGGLGATDIGNKTAIGGVSKEFYARIFRHYEQANTWKQETKEQYAAKRRAPGNDTMWTFEPHVAEQVFLDFIKEHKIPVVYGERLDLKSGVKKDGLRIVSITMESGKAFSGKEFIDATYEGDLLAKAGCSYHVGREANAVYNETLNGVQTKNAKSHQFTKPVDPFLKPGDPQSGLLPGLHDGGPGEEGSGDRRVQAYNFRVCMTDAPENRVPWPKPKNYDPLRYEILLRYIQAGVWESLNLSTPMPNRKTDTNNHGAFSSDNIGMNYDFPDGDYATRERIFQEHVTYHTGMLWFLANDERVPKNVHDVVNKWGLSKDEFVDSGNWPQQMYVREARRLISDYVMTQHNCQGKNVAEDSIGLGAYNMDSHNTQRYVKDGRIWNEGDVQVGVSPYPISYRSLIPKEKECSNLLVPVCLSASHIAYGSIRMEPVFMVLGQSAATAACHAIDTSVSVQKVDYKKLREKLLADQQVLEWTGPKRDSAAAEGKKSGLDPQKLPGIVLDDVDAEFTGEWASSSVTPGFVGAGYRHDGNDHKGKLSAKFTLSIAEPGTYEVRVSYTPSSNRATNVPVTFSTGKETKTTHVNQRQATAAADQGFVSVGKIVCDAKSKLTVVISNEGTDGHVIVDAVQAVALK